MLMTFISMFGGGILRILPEIIGLFGKGIDNSHELAMLVAQTELEKLQAADKQALAVTQGTIDQTLAAMTLQGEALKGQMQLSGIKFVDALNMLVRPLVTYYFLILFGIYKAAMLSVALVNQDVWHAILQVYTADDAAMLSGILAFWFVGRVFEKSK